MIAKPDGSGEVHPLPEPRDRLPAPPAFATPPPEVVPIEVVREDVPIEVVRDAPIPTQQERAAVQRPRPRPVPRRPSNRELLRRALSSPHAARQAYVLREVLGPPVSLRTGDSRRDV